LSVAVRTAVLPVAGWGTRFLPVTKAVPKEMLPIVDRPCLAYVVAEAIAAGVDQIVLVTARGKTAMEDYFDRSPALEQVLEAGGKRELLAEVQAVARHATVISVRQQEQRGLGHAVLMAAPVIGDNDFAVMLPDDIVDGRDFGQGGVDDPALAQILRVHAQTGGVVVTLKEVPRADTRRYGICAGSFVQPNRMNIDRMVEKPKPEEAPSNFSIVGRYVLPASIFDVLRAQAPGAIGEIQLTDALAVYAARGQATGVVFTGTHFDTGNPVGLLDANLHFALHHPTLGAAAQAVVAKYR